MTTSQGQTQYHERIEKLIDGIYTAPAGAVRNALVTLLAAEEALAAALKSEANPAEA